MCCTHTDNVTIHGFSPQHFTHIAEQVRKHNVRADASLSLHLYTDHVTVTLGDQVIAWCKNPNLKP